MFSINILSGNKSPGRAKSYAAFKNCLLCTKVTGCIRRSSGYVARGIYYFQYKSNLSFQLSRLFIILRLQAACDAMRLAVQIRYKATAIDPLRYLPPQGSPPKC
jgi:hypothetical protein